MITNQMQVLNKTGIALIEKSASLNKVSEIEKCINLGSSLLAQSRAIMESQKLNSSVVFAEICVSSGIEVKYSLYCEFCVRNSLEMYSETDFNLRLKPLLRELKKNGTEF